MDSVQKDKNHLIASLDPEGFDKTQYPVMIKFLETRDIKDICQHNKAIYSKPTASINLNGEKKNQSLSAKIRKKSRSSTYSISIHIRRQVKDLGDSDRKGRSPNIFVFR